MNLLNHKAISASAGSGKTFRLAHRYMGLLARGVKPDRICALTFSRKAAGEIFDSIVRYVTASAQNPEQAELSCQYMDAGPVPPAEFLSILRSFVENLHSVNIGTLDSFIVGIIRSFPLELGLNSAEFNLMDNDSAGAESFRETVIAAACGSKQVKKTEANIFLESFRQATLGMEKKTFADNLKSFMNNYRAAFLSIPAENSWGNPALIWELAPWWLKQPPAPKKEKAQILQMTAAKSGWDKRMLNSLEKLTGKLAEFDSDSAWEPDVFLAGRIQEQIIKNLNMRSCSEQIVIPAQAGIQKTPSAADWIPISMGMTEHTESSRNADCLKIEYANKEYLFPARVSQALRELYHNLFHVQFSRLFKRTRGLYRVIAMYEEEYEKALLQTGNMTFTDAQLMLSPHGLASGGIIVSRSPDPQEGRLFIDYRLDSRIDHWLLDEFQDTSNLQWQALENLADEILQDDGNTRSFFYVGDVKQTIYRWRGGNPDLFNSVLERYNRRIINEPLNETQRSSQPIIDTVNKVFSRLPETQGKNSEPAIPEPVRAKWNSVWEEHKCAKQVPADGYTALSRPVLPEGAKCHENEERLDLLARLLKHIRPMERKLSAAILVRTNKTGKKIADYLRQYCPEMNISYEGETALLDSPVIVLLLDLLRYAEHPADNFAKQHLIMSPLGIWLNKSSLSLEALLLSVLQAIQAKGFKSVIRDWASRLGPLDAFGSLRLGQMLEIAGRFDVRCDRNIPLFIKTVETYGMREASEAGGCIHIMTIHQSKGLGFDLVVLPDLNTNDNLNSAGAIDFLTGRSGGADASPWLLTIPGRKTAECDPVLKQSLENCDHLETLDNLCLLYVAMTRAKKALYMITKIQKKKFYNAAAFLEQQLADNDSQKQNARNGGTEADILYETGNSHWFEGLDKPGFDKPFSQKKSGQDKGIIPGKARRARLEKIEPSLEENVALKASWLFKAESPEVLYFGSAIHGLFRQIEWSDDCKPDEIIRAWRPEYPYPDIVLRDVKEQFRQVMAEPKIKEKLSKPAGLVELWREKSFDVILDNKWISGIFDRVVILRDAAGNPLAAQIMDYKSNRTSDPEKIGELVSGYRPQILLYRRALANLLNLPEEKIETCLLFTVPRQIVKV